jgi:antirestriction protein ArdC
MPNSEPTIARARHQGRRDLYQDVSNRIIAELEAGAAPWVKPWSATPGRNVPCNAVSNRPYSGCNVVLLWMAANAGYRMPRYLTFKQALELGGHVRKGEHGHRVYFVKQLQVREAESDDVRIVPMLREYTVFNLDQCEGLPEWVFASGPIKVRNSDERDAAIDEFLAASGAAIREGHGEAYYRPGGDFISLPAFAAFKSAATFYGVAFHELGHNADSRIMPRQGHRPRRYPGRRAPSFGIIRKAVSDDRFGCIAEASQLQRRTSADINDNLYLNRSSFHRTKESPRRLRPDTRMSERRKESRDSRVPISS